MDNTIVFENADKSLAKELLMSSPDFTVEDVKTLANMGALTLEDARSVMVKMESTPFSLDRQMKDDVLQKKSLIMIAKENNDPEFKSLLDYHDKIQGIYASLEAKYGDQARLNRQSLIGKLMSKFRGSAIYQNIAGKVSSFQ